MDKTLESLSEQNKIIFENMKNRDGYIFKDTEPFQSVLLGLEQIKGHTGRERPKLIRSTDSGKTSQMIEALAYSLAEACLTEKSLTIVLVPEFKDITKFPLRDLYSDALRFIDGDLRLDLGLDTYFGLSNKSTIVFTTYKHMTEIETINHCNFFILTEAENLTERLYNKVLKTSEKESFLMLMVNSHHVSEDSFIKTIL
jgi:hypothetical protein